MPATSRLPEPPRVARARGLEKELGFERSSIPEVGRLLHVLAAQRGRMRVGELGTGCGIGAAWMVSALPSTVPFVTVEVDETLAAAASELFAEDENVRDDRDGRSHPAKAQAGRIRCASSGSATPSSQRSRS